MMENPKSSSLFVLDLQFVFIVGRNGRLIYGTFFGRSLKVEEENARNIFALVEVFFMFSQGCGVAKIAKTIAVVNQPR